MKRIIRVKWKNLLVLAIFTASMTLLMHDAYILSIGNLFNKYTVSLTAYGCVIDLIALFISSASYDILGGK